MRLEKTPVAQSVFRQSMRVLFDKEHFRNRVFNRSVARLTYGRSTKVVSSLIDEQDLVVAAAFASKPILKLYADNHKVIEHDIGQWPMAADLN